MRRGLKLSFQNLKSQHAETDQNNTRRLLEDRQ